MISNHEWITSVRIFKKYFEPLKEVFCISKLAALYTTVYHLWVSLTHI